MRLLRIRVGACDGGTSNYRALRELPTADRSVPFLITREDRITTKRERHRCPSLFISAASGDHSGCCSRHRDLIFGGHESALRHEREQTEKGDTFSHYSRSDHRYLHHKLSFPLALDHDDGDGDDVKRMPSMSCRRSWIVPFGPRHFRADLILSISSPVGINKLREFFLTTNSFYSTS